MRKQLVVCMTVTRGKHTKHQQQCLYSLWIDSEEIEPGSKLLISTFLHIASWSKYCMIFLTRASSFSIGWNCLLVKLCNVSADDSESDKLCARQWMTRHKLWEHFFLKRNCSNRQWLQGFSASEVKKLEENLNSKGC